ncbi:MAG: hypothetical protein PWP76_621 [Candidatus Diapherotrites archaeon]|nr:hypothetical protein [Candidatus Diapherotrites archaeon]MDN5366765.1 hypothetical protein [Candidatus Diapherotrites archaeon]
MVEEIARKVYFSRLRKLNGQFREKLLELRDRKGYHLAKDALRFSRTEEAFHVFHDAFQRVLDEINRYPGRRVVIAPVPHGGEFVGTLFHEALQALRERGLVDKDVEFLRIEKLPGREFRYTPPEGEHLFILVDDAYGSGNTARKVLSRHPRPQDAKVVALSAPERSDRYMYAKMLAVLSYLDRALRGEPELLDELVEKKKNKGAYVSTHRDAWRVDDF